MDDNIDVAARREARRRRILQNPEERLRKLKGLKEAEPLEIDVLANEEPGLAPVVPTAWTAPPVDHLHIRVAAAQLDVNLPPSKPAPVFEVAQPPASETEVLPGPSVLQAEPTSTGLWSRLVSSRLHVVLLAVVVRTLLATGHSFVFGNMVLAPLVWLELTVYMTGADGGARSKPGGLIGAAFILSGFEQSKVHSLLWVAEVLQQLATNIAVYIFTFLLSHAACLWLFTS